MKVVYDVTKVLVTKNPKYARVCGFDVETGSAFNELYGKQETIPLVVGDKVTLGYKVYKNGNSEKRMTFVNKVKVNNA